MDAITLLTADHNRVRGLFKRFQDAEEKDDTTTMTSLAELIFEQLTVHTSIEETTFYPQVKRESEELKETVDEGLEEHTVAKRLIAECQQGEPGSDEWKAKMKVLIESVEHHADEEETEMFPKVRSAFKGDGLEQLGTALEAEKKKLGAPVLADAIDLTKEELAAKASEQEIPGRSKMSHDELAATVDPRF
jgi:hemerythrin superfamily protein